MKKMNNKGEISIGVFVLLFVGAIVVLSLIPSIAQNVGQVTNVNGVVNESLVIPAALNTAVTLQGQSVSSVVITNATGYVISSGNYTVTNNVVSNGVQTANIKFTVAGFNGTTVKGTYTSQPTTYAAESGSRTVAGLIVLFASLGLAAWIIYWVVKEGGEVFR